MPIEWRSEQLIEDWKNAGDALARVLPQQDLLEEFDMESFVHCLRTALTRHLPKNVTKLLRLHENRSEREQRVQSSELIVDLPFILPSSRSDGDFMGFKVDVNYGPLKTDLFLTMSSKTPRDVPAIEVTWERIGLLHGKVGVLAGPMIVGQEFLKFVKRWMREFESAVEYERQVPSE